MRTFLVVLALMLCLVARAQQAPEVHKINGKRYILHVVQPGNTLYGISKLYSVSVEDLQRENVASLTEGLRVNQTLLVPVPDDVKKPDPVAQQQNHVLIHKVQKGETLYAISKKYNCTLEDILTNNPEVKDQGLKMDSEILIPIKGVPADPKHGLAAKTDTLKTYTVQKGETIFGLSKLFQVHAADLVRANDGLPFGLVEGMIIRVPMGGVVPPPDPKQQAKEGKEQKKIVQAVVVAAPPAEVTEVKGSSVLSPALVPVNIALLLPFSPTFPDTSNKYDFQISESARVALSLYRGVRFAVDSLCEDLNLDCRVNVVNLPRDTVTLELVLESPEFLSNDVIIGPLYNEQFTRVATFCQPHGIPVICPIAKPSKLLFNHPNAFKTLPSENMQLSSLAEFAATQLKDSNLYLINANKFQNQEDIDFFKTRFAAAAGVPLTMTEDAIRELKMWEINRETLTMRFPQPGSYTLIVPTDNGVFITRLLSGLYNFNFDMRGRYRFRVVGLESWQRRDEDLDINHLHGLNVTLPLSAHLDFDRPEVVRFFKDYHRAYGFDPDLHVAQAFDVTQWILTAIDTNDSSWSTTATLHSGVVSNYDFTRVMETSGSENRFVRFYEYENYKLKEIGSWPLPKK